MPAKYAQDNRSYFGKAVEFVYNIFWYCYPFSMERIISRELRNYKEVCDLGCSEGGFIWRLKHFRKNSSINFCGCDIHHPYILSAQKTGVFRDLVECDIRKPPFKPGSFDVAMVIMVIEHLEKDPEYIKRFEDIARDKVIITTSNGYSYNPEEGVIHQRHLSGHSAEDFRRLGYRVKGLGGSRFLCGDLYKEYRIPLAFRPIFSFIYLLSTVFTYHRPELADHIICVKYKQEKNHA